MLVSQTCSHLTICQIDCSSVGACEARSDRLHVNQDLNKAIDMIHKCTKISKSKLPKKAGARHYLAFLATSCSSFHLFLIALAADLFPKRNVDVCLSAPVVLEYEDDSPKITTHVPHIPISPVIADINVPRCPIEFVEL